MRAIVAVCSDWGIGNKGQLLVRNKADMHHFVECTTGGTVVMGRRTLESFPGGRPLKNRRNIVLTHGGSTLDPGAETVGSIDELLSAVKDEDPDKVWVIGGASVYKELLPFCSDAIVTKADCVREADAFFPNLDEDPGWSVTDETDEDVTPEGIAFRFVTYQNDALK
ncbi:MAG: dihydrofolate reductase [Atopobiaceae bacterium]